MGKTETHYYSLLWFSPRATFCFIFPVFRFSGASPLAPPSAGSSFIISCYYSVIHLCVTRHVPFILSTPLDLALKAFGVIAHPRFCICTLPQQSQINLILILWSLVDGNFCFLSWWHLCLASSGHPRAIASSTQRTGCRVNVFDMSLNRLSKSHNHVLFI